MKKILLLASIIILPFLGYLFTGVSKPAQNIIWGVNFSQKHAESLGLDWREVYSSLIDDLGARNIKLAAYWDLIEKENGSYDFRDLDWQVEKAEKAGSRILPVIGMKSPRWPECHTPDWAKSLSKAEQQESILKLLENIVLRYKNSEFIWAWQVENEPFFPFGECQWTDKDFLKKEINLVKSLDDKKRPVVISESGEFPLWFMAARYGDIVGVTMYKKVWVHQVGRYFTYPFPSVFYSRKESIVKKLFGKKVIGIELQAEPWCSTLIYDCSFEEQKKTMNLEQFKYNIEFAKNTGIAEHYLWGAEWWYWMKERQGDSSIWEEAKKLFE